MLILWLYLVWVIAVSSVSGLELSPFNSLSNHEFCSGIHHVSVKPSYIPQLLDYLKFCSTSSKQPNVDSYARRQAVIHLFNAATPVIHKAFFESKTALKYVVLFTKLKHEAVQYANYANKYGDHSMYSRKKPFTNEGTLTYAPENDDGSYNLNEDIRVCASILNRQQNTSVRNILKASQLPRVAKAARIITFPPFNLSVAVSSEDTPYLVLDMYVLAMRCLSFTNLHPNTTVQVSKHLISTLKRKVMSFVPPNEFERAYSGMMSMAHLGSADGDSSKTTTSSAKRSPATSKIENPVVLKLQYSERNGSDAIIPNENKNEITIISNFTSSPKKSFCEAFMALLKRKTKNDVHALVTGKTRDDQTSDKKALIMISVILGACATLAVVLYCLLFGCCGWLTVSKEGVLESDDVDDRLEGYARLSSGKQPSKCYCTLADSNQMDVIAALHQRCELLSKKICQVVREISKENVFEDPESMNVLREFVRSVSSNMVDENETIYHFGKSISSLIKPQKKMSSVKQNTL